MDQLLIPEPPVIGGNGNRVAAESDLEAVQVEEVEPVTRSPVHVAQAAQLLAFLEKSEHIEGPRRDLIYLESTGHLFGLDSSFADRLEEFAVNGQRSAVIAALRELEDDDARVAALRLLAQATRDSDLHGVEARNCMSSLLGAVSGLPDLDLAVAAGELAQTVGAHVRSYDLKPVDLPGAFLVAVGTPLESGDELIQDLMDQEDALETDPVLGNLVLAHGDRVLPRHQARLARLVARRVVDGDEDMAALLLGLEERLLAPLLREAEQHITAELEPPDATEEDADPEAQDREPAIHVLSSLLSSLLESGMRDAAAVAAATILAQADSDGDENVRGRLGDLGTIGNAEVARDLLDAAGRSDPESWETWLEPIDPTLYSDAAVQRRVQRLTRLLWREAERDTGLAPDALESALGILTRLARRPSWEDGSVEDAITASFAIDATDDDAATQQDRLLHLAERFASAGLTDFEAVATAAVPRFVTVLSSDVSSSHLAVVDLLATWGPRLGALVAAEQRQALVDAIPPASWLPSPVRETLLLELAAEQARLGEVETSPLSAADVEGLIGQFGGKASRAVAAWLQGFTPKAQDVWSALRSRASVSPDPGLVDALRAYAADQPAAAAAVVVRLVRGTSGVPSASLLRALRGSAHDDVQLADVLIARYEKAGNNAARERVLQAWEAADIRGDGARKRLLREVLLPCAAGSKQGLDIAIRRIKLADPAPYGTRSEIRQRLRAAAYDKASRKKVEAGLRSIGLVKKGFFGSQDVE